MVLFDLEQTEDGRLFVELGGGDATTLSRQLRHRHRLAGRARCCIKTYFVLRMARLLMGIDQATISRDNAATDVWKSIPKILAER